MTDIPQIDWRKDHAKRARLEFLIEYERNLMESEFYGKIEIAWEKGLVVHIQDKKNVTLPSI